MKRLDKYNSIITLLTGLATVLVSLWIVFGYLHNQSAIMDKILQNTLKNTITNENLTVEERLGACDVYIEQGFNSATKLKCERLYESAK